MPDGQHYLLLGGGGVSEANGRTGVWGSAPVLPSAVRLTFGSLCYLGRVSLRTLPYKAAGRAYFYKGGAQHRSTYAASGASFTKKGARRAVLVTKFERM